MSQDNEKDEPSVDEILSSIKDVIASDKDVSVSYTHLRAHETREDLVCRLVR